MANTFDQRRTEAADWAAAHSCGFVTDLDDATRQRLRDAITNAVRQRLGISHTARCIRNVTPARTMKRALQVATDAMCAAFSFAELNSIRRLGVCKRIIASTDPCPTCAANQAAGPIAADRLFPSGHMAPPFCSGCRCAIGAARKTDA
jgi:hypothetical protein